MRHFGLLAALTLVVIAALAAASLIARDAAATGLPQASIADATATVLPSPDPDRAPRSGDRPVGTPTGPQGIPAITPQLRSADPRQPAFSAQHVTEYVLAHPVAGTGRIQTDTPIAVESVEFLTAGEVQARLGRPTGQPDETLLCLVTIRGQFTLHGMRGIKPTQGTTALRVFDAKTGNFLLQTVDAR